ncbi:MAG: hypothetical protein RBG13Loki_3100 [Promethearchaeota archaeon CR_4]|nr:MAG: hypothetical protein RBG13Loki_3100 [Candidatus Lokiarchaeota archaeon CR_4]
MVNEDMPYFRQFPNACGLTSLLMALKPAPRKIDAILNYGWDKIGAMFQASSKESPEYRWQRVLEFLLTACTQHPLLRSYLKEHYPTFSKQVCPWLENALLNLAWDDLREPHPVLLHATDLIMHRVKTMKHNVELKILAFLFGCRFLPWKKGGDGTGAVTFTREELLDSNESQLAPSAIKKLAFIQKGLKNEGPVLWGASFHWLTPKDLQVEEDVNVLIYHDPMGGHDHSIQITSLRETDLFYVFTFDAQLLEEHIPILKQSFDIPVVEAQLSPEVISVEAEPLAPHQIVKQNVTIEEEEEGGKFDNIEFSDDVVFKKEAFAQQIKTLLDEVAMKDQQLTEKNEKLIELKRQLVQKNREIKKLKKKLGKL